MLAITLLALALSLGNTAWSPDSVTADASSRVSAGMPQPGRTTLNGFVELYWNEPAHLLSGGMEIPLVGATDLVMPHGGLQITVSGRYLSDGTFLVESVSRHSGQRVQGMGSENTSM